MKNLSSTAVGDLAEIQTAPP